MAQQYKLTVGENGRVAIPAKIRKYLKIGSGDQILMVMDQDVRIIPIKDELKNFQNLIKEQNPNNISLVDSLISQRRKEAENE